jgi:hypothetical protein
LLIATFHDEPGPDLRHENDVRMYELVERALLDQAEPPACEPLAGGDPASGEMKGV